MSTATDMLAAYLAAETAVLAGKTYTLGHRTVTRENLAEIRKGRMEWEARVRAEQFPSVPRIGGLGFAVANLSGEVPRL